METLMVKRISLASIALVAALHLLSPVAHSETEAVSEISFSILCKDEIERFPLSACTDFIRANYGPNSDLIVGIRDAIDAKKDMIKEKWSKAEHYDRWLQNTLILLTFLTTVATAIARIYRDSKWGKKIEVGLYPIVLAAMVTLFTNFSAYYNFDEAGNQHRTASSDLAKLQTDFDYFLLRHAISDERPITLKSDDIENWKKRFDGIVSLYSEEIRNNQPALIRTGHPVESVSE